MRPISALARDLPARGVAQHVLLLLASYANGSGEEVRPSVATLVEASGLSRATVFRALDRLKGMGAIEAVEPSHAQAPVVYRLRITGVSQVDPSHSETGGVSERDGRGLTVRREGSHSETQRAIEEPLKRRSPPPTPPAGGRKRKRTPVEVQPELVDLDGFESFWRKYPKKRSKPDARRAWAETEKTRPNLDRILAVLDEHLESETWNELDGKWIPWPAKWLREGRWDDVLDKREGGYSW